MSRVSATASIPGVAPQVVEAAWCDPGRWPEFVDGLARVVRASPGYPQAGSTVEWESFPAGRGKVRETVIEHVPGSLLSSRVEDDSTIARQDLLLEAQEGGTSVVLGLDYEIRRRGPFTGVTDLLFVRRAQADSLRRTLSGLEQAVVPERP